MMPEPNSPAQWSREPWTEDGPDMAFQGNYARARACVNFCAGVPTDELIASGGISGLLFSRNAALRSQHNELCEALQEVFALIDEQWLVRNIERDGEPDFWTRQIEPTRKLAKAHAALSRIEKGGAM